jgi:hypothetical protein
MYLTNPNKLRMSVNMTQPLELPIGRDVLINVMEDVLANMRQNRVYLEETPEDTLELDAMVEQREQFLAWLRAQPGPNVNMALYPLDAPGLIVARPGPGLVS